MATPFMEAMQWSEQRPMRQATTDAYLKEITGYLQALDFKQKQEQQAQQQRQRDQAAAGAALTQMYGQPPQPAPTAPPMPPGAPSGPIAPKPAAAPPSMGMAAAGAAAGPPPPMGWNVGPTASPALGGATRPPMAPSGGGMPMPAGSPPSQEPVIPDSMLSVPSLISQLDKAKVPDDQKLRVLEMLEPVIEKQQKSKLDDLRMKVAVDQAAAAAAKAKKEEILAQRAAAGEDLRPSALVRNAEYAAGGDKAKAREIVAGKLAGKKAVGPKGGSAGTEYESIPKTKAEYDEAVRWYAIQQLGGFTDWRTGISRVRGGSQLILDVDKAVPQLAKEFKITAADAGTNRARAKASQAALTQLGKDLATIEPFEKMLVQNADILKGLADKAVATQAALANKTLNWLRTHAADSPDVAEYLAQMELVKTEAARIIQNPRLVGQLTDTAREELQQVLNGTMPLNATKRVIDRLVNDSQRRVTAMKEQQGSLEQGMRGMMSPQGQSGGKIQTGPKAGDVEGGFRFKGGDPAKKENWEKV